MKKIMEVVVSTLAGGVLGFGVGVVAAVVCGLILSFLRWDFNVFDDFSVQGVTIFARYVAVLGAVFGLIMDLGHKYP